MPWKPPSYAIPTTDNEEWTPPDYAEEVKTQDEKKPGLLSKVIDALKPAEKIHATGDFIPASIKKGWADEVTKPKTKTAEEPDFGNRPDGTKKGNGFLGVFKLPNGSVASEYSIADSEQLRDEKGNYIDYPSLVPTLTKDEVKQVLDAANNGKDVPDSVKVKAEAHALERKKQGLPLFANNDETNTSLHPDLERAGSKPKVNKDITREDTNILGFDQNKWTDMASKLPEKWHGLPIRYPAAFAGSLAGTLGEALSAPEQVATDFATAGLKGSTKKAVETAAEEIPIKQPRELQSKELPYRMGGSTQNLAKDVELASDVPKKVDEVKKPFINPFEKKEPIIAGPSSLETDERHLPIRSPNLARDYTSDVETSRPKTGGVTEDQIYNMARDKFNMGRDLPAEEVKPTATFKYEGPEGKMYDIQGGTSDKSTVSADKLNELGIDIPESPAVSEKLTGEQLRAKARAEWKPPSYATPVEKGEVKLGSQEQPIIDIKDITKNPAELHPQLTALRNYGDGVLHMDFDKNATMTEDSVKSLLQSKGIDANVTEMTTNDKLPSRFRIDVQGNDSVESAQKADDLEKSIGGAFDSESELHGGLGGTKPSSRVLEPNKGPYGAALDKLFNSMGSMMDKRFEQDAINKTERAKRFAAFSNVKEEGALGAAKSLSTLKGEYEKVDFDKLKMTKPQVDSLFTAVRRANITPGEKARGYTTLFKIMNGEGVPQRNELRVLDDVFGNDFSSKIIEMHGGIGAVGLKLSKAANTMKSMENAISLAAPLRHGAGLMYRKEFYPAFRDMFKFFGDKEFYNTSMKALEERPNYMLGREGGLFLAKPGSLQSSEEEFLNSYVGQIPKFTGIPQTVGASQRGYIGFLNKLRADTFDAMIKRARDLGYESHTKVEDQIIPTKETKAIAKFINNATGRGDLGSLNKMTNELNLLLWSPRMISSRINMLANPKIYTDLPKGMRLDGLKSLLGIASMGLIINGLSSLGGAKVGTNILSTDFMKSRFPGNKVVDPNAGLQQYVVAAARFLAGKTDNDRAYPPTTRADIAGQFLKNKESPAASLAHALLTARKFTGQSDNPETAGNFTDQYGNKTSIQSEIGKRFLPIFIQDLSDLVKSEPKWSDDIGLTAAMTGASLAGMSQEYPERGKSKLGFRKLK